MLVSSIPVAYALARLRWKGRDAVFLLVLVAMMLPPQVTIVPLYVMWAKLNLVGTLWPLILPNLFGDAFSIFLLRQFFLTIPESYLDAARVDGCGELRILVSVVCRLAKPAIAAVALFMFLFTFSDFFGPLLYAGDDEAHWTLSVGLAQFRTLHQVQWNLTMAATMHGAGAGRRPVLPRPEGVRRGRHADGGEGVKLAVIGAGSTYTPELVSGLVARSTSASSCCTTSTRERREVVGGARAADARPRRLRAAGWSSPASSSARSTAPTSC